MLIIFIGILTLTGLIMANSISTILSLMNISYQDEIARVQMGALISIIESEKQLTEVGIYSIEECLLSALRECKLAKREISVISYAHVEELYFKGSFPMMTSVFIQLIKDAFKHAADDAQINIWCDENILFFIIYGKWLKPKFDSDGEHALGLKFCSTAMTKLGGFMQCQYIHDKYMEVALVFPRVYA